MRKNGRFLIGLVGVALAVTYLIWTGVSETMVYYLTPTELVARAAADPAFHEIGVKVSGRVVPGTHERGPGSLHRFVVRDLEHDEVRIAVEFDDVLPDTFAEDGEVVLEGRYRPSGVFEATAVLTKCGSRYEAMPEELTG